MDKIDQNLNSFLKGHNNIKGIFVPSSRISIVANYIDKEFLNKIQLVGFAWCVG